MKGITANGGRTPHARHIRCVAWLSFLLLTSFLAVQATASGRLPPTPVPSQTFPSAPACHDHLRQMQARDASSEHDTGWEPDGDGSFSRVTMHQELDAGSVPDSLIYKTSRWTHAAVPQPPQQFRRYEIHHSYVMATWRCEGARLEGMKDRGYTMSTFEDELPE